MSINKKQITNLLLNNNNQLLEIYFKKISEDYNIDYKELKNRYLLPVKKNKKRNINKKGRQTNYSMFLSDTNVLDTLKEKFGDKFNDMRFPEISREKSKIWNAMSKAEKDIYRKKAEEYNKKLNESTN